MEPDNRDILIRQIDKISLQTWKELFLFIRRIKSTKSFSKIVGCKEQADGTINMPFRVHGKIITDFINCFSGAGLMVSFDWSKWERGRQVYVNHPPSDLSSFDLPDLCNLITMLIRADRFMDGVLSQSFENGFILAVLIEIEKRINSQH